MRRKETHLKPNDQNSHVCTAKKRCLRKLAAITRAFLASKLSGEVFMDGYMAYMNQRNLVFKTLELIDKTGETTLDAELSSLLHENLELDTCLENRIATFGLEFRNVVFKLSEDRRKISRFKSGLSENDGPLFDRKV